MPEHLTGTGPAPLAATREYTFTRGAELTLEIPWRQRGPFDDFGAVEHAEQEAFLTMLFAELAVEAHAGRPGGFTFPDAAGLDRVWETIRRLLKPVVKAAPTASAKCKVTTGDAPAVDSVLTRRFLNLVSVVAGLTEGAFACLDQRLETGDQTTRFENWKRGEVMVRVDATGIESAYGVHGEECTRKIVGKLTDGRDVSLYSRIDMRSGGDVSITVTGVLDAKALADAFIGSTALPQLPVR